jgi:hypothetical protein
VAIRRFRALVACTADRDRSALLQRILHVLLDLVDGALVDQGTDF